MSIRGFQSVYRTRVWKKVIVGDNHYCDATRPAIGEMKLVAWLVSTGRLKPDNS